MTIQKISGLLGGSVAGAQAALGVSPVYPSLLPRTRRAIARVRSGMGNGRFLCIGDSTVLGVWSAGGLTTGDMKPNAWPTHLANLLNASGVNAHANSFFACGSNTLGAPSNGTNDSRLVVGSSWTAFINQPTIGGSYLRASDATNSLSFTPTQNCDTFNVFYPSQAGAGYGKFNVKINAAAAAVVDENAGASFGISVATKTGTLGANTCNITWDSVAPCYITGVEGYDSSKKWISVCNAGRSGAKASDLVTPGILLALPGIAPDLTIISVGINDWCNSVPVSTFSANLQTIITTALAVGDVLLVSPFPSNPGGSGAPLASVQYQYVSALQALAVANSVPLVDVYGRFNAYSTANSLNFMGDDLHPNQSGYADAAQAIFNAISRL